MKSLKYFIFILNLILPIVCLSSCSVEDTELRNRLIIEGIGVDIDDGEYTLTVQALNTEQSQSTDNPSSSEAVSVYTVTGASVAQALGSVRELTGKVPLYSQNRVIILGDSVTQDNIFSELDFFVREYASRMNVIVAVSEGKAADILDLDSDSGSIGAKTIQEIIEQGHIYSRAPSSEVYILMNAFADPSAGEWLPLLGVEDDVRGGEPCVVLRGACVLKNGRKLCTLNSSEVMFVLMMTGEFEKGALSFSDPDGVAITAEITKSNVKTTLDKKPASSADIKVKCSAGILEYAAGDPDSIDSKKLDEITKQLEKKLIDGMRSVADKLLRLNKVDIFGFDRRYSIKNPDEFYAVQDDWDALVGSMSVNIDADVVLRRIGINSADYR